MLLKDPLRVETRCPRHWTFSVAGGLLSLAVLVAGFGYRAEAASDDVIVIIIRKDGDKAAEKKTDPKAVEKKIQIELKGDEKGKFVVPPDIDLKGEPKIIIEKIQQLQDKGANQEEIVRKAMELAKQYHKDIELHIKPPAQGGQYRKSKQPIDDLEQLQKELQKLQRELEKLRADQAKEAAQEKLIKDRTEHLQQLIAKAKQGQATARPRFGVAVEPLAAAVGEHLDLPKNVGMVVVEVFADSPAAKVGLKPKDILYKIDGAMIPNNTEDFFKLIASLKSNTPLDVVVIRKGQQQKLGTVQLADGQGGKDMLFKKEPGGQAKKLEELLADQKKRPAEIKAGHNMTVKRQDGDTSVTIHGQLADGKFRISSVEVRDKNGTRTFERIEDVPEPYRARAMEALETLQHNIAPPKTK